MSEQREWYAGVDWGSENHHVHLMDDAGGVVAERVFKHSGEGLHELVDWLSQAAGAPAHCIRVAIETPHGPVVDALLERGFEVYAINPKQLDRFRDRFTLAGAKDDSLDSLVLASSVRTDRHCFRRIETIDPVRVELREWSRLTDELTTERVRLANRLREQLWRYFPAFLDLEEDFAAEWLLDLWQAAPTPAKAARLREATVAAILKKHRIRRFDAVHVLTVLRRPRVEVMPGTVTAACAHIETLLPRIRLIQRQIKQAYRTLDQILEKLGRSQEPAPGQPVEQRDVAILASWPGLRRINLATLLAEAWQSLRERNYHALRCLCGAAPVTKRSGKTKFVVRRQSFHPRLANAVYHWARTAVKYDAASQLKYKALRARGRSHAGALRSVADRLLFVLCTMLKNGTLYRPSPPAEKPA
jgi:transposase